ncbi:MAG: hypothetical protein JNL37_00025 [Thauera sp.]|nr:hypothetical protein [Thauera sp.]
MLVLAVGGASCTPAAGEAAVTSRGIGPMQLGVPLAEAARDTQRFDPAAGQIGPGCDERDQISVVLRAAGESLSVMAMAGADANIEEILAIPADGAGAVTLADAEACRAHGAAFAARLAPRLGEALAWSVRDRPVSHEFVFPFAGDVRVVSRWFAGGKSCDLLLQFGSKSPVAD